MGTGSKVIKCTGFHWESVERKEYKDDSRIFEGVHRYTLLGKGEDEDNLDTETRYFEVEEGGYTSFERHNHPHSVVVIRGCGLVILGNETHDLNLHDVVYVAPGTLHQFHADKDEKLGFLCIVDRNRDRPVLPEDEEVDRVITSKEVRGKIRR